MDVGQEGLAIPRGGGVGVGGDEVREQDRFLPVANIARIMKRVLPPNEKIAKDAKEAVQECVSEFICFVTSEASDRCQTEKRKTINGDDLVWAMGTLGFDEYVDPLKKYLAKYRAAAKGEKGAEKRAGRASAAMPASATPHDEYEATLDDEAVAARAMTDDRTGSPPHSRRALEGPDGGVEPEARGDGTAPGDATAPDDGIAPGDGGASGDGGAPGDGGEAISAAPSMWLEEQSAP